MGAWVPRRVVIVLEEVSVPQGSHNVHLRGRTGAKVRRCGTPVSVRVYRSPTG